MAHKALLTYNSLLSLISAPITLSIAYSIPATVPSFAVPQIHQACDPRVFALTSSSAEIFFIKVWASSLHLLPLWVSVQISPSLSDAYPI